MLHLYLLIFKRLGPRRKVELEHHNAFLHSKICESEKVYELNISERVHESNGTSCGKDYNGKVRFPWEKPRVEDGKKRNLVKFKSKTYVAEFILPELGLTRMRNLAFRLRNKIRVTGACVTREMVAGIKNTGNQRRL
nr:CRM family member 3A [Tanacetum cinerariifolium]